MIENIEYFDFDADVCGCLSASELIINFTLNDLPYSVRVKCNIDVETGTEVEEFDDPGEYPSNAGGSPYKTEYVVCEYVTKFKNPRCDFYLDGVYDENDESYDNVDNYFTDEEVKLIEDELYVFVNDTFVENADYKLCNS